MKAEQLDSLAAAFVTLGRLHLAPPDDATYAQLREMYTEWPLRAASDGEYAQSTPADDGPTSDAGSDVTAAGLAYWEQSFARDEDVKDIASDLDKLYGRTATAKVAPYESVHRNRDGLVFDEETLQVRNEYREMGLEAPNLNREPDDHIGLEFDFVAQVLIRSLTAVENDAPAEAERYLGTIRRFYVQHLGEWAPQMLESAQSEATTYYIKGLMAVSRGALDQLAASLGIDNE